MRVCYPVCILFLSIISGDGGSPAVDIEKEKDVKIKEKRSILKQAPNNHDSLLKLPLKYLFGTDALSKDKLEQDLISLTNFTSLNSNYRKKGSISKPIKKGLNEENVSFKTIIENEEEKLVIRRRNDRLLGNQSRVRNSSEKNSPIKTTNEPTLRTVNTLDSKDLNSSKRPTKQKRNRPNDALEKRLSTRKNTKPIPVITSIKSLLHPLVSQAKNKTREKKKKSHFSNDNQKKYEKNAPFNVPQECKHGRSSIGGDSSHLCKHFFAFDAEFKDKINNIKSQETEEVLGTKEQNNIQIKRTHEDSFMGQKGPKELSGTHIKDNKFFQYQIPSNLDKPSIRTSIERNVDQNSSLDVNDSERNKLHEIKSLERSVKFHKTDQIGSSSKVKYIPLSLMDKGKAKPNDKEMEKNYHVKKQLPGSDKTVTENVDRNEDLYKMNVKTGTELQNEATYLHINTSKLDKLNTPKSKLLQAANGGGNKILIYNKTLAQNGSFHIESTRNVNTRQANSSRTFVIDGSKPNVLSLLLAPQMNDKKLWNSDYEREFRLLQIEHKTTPSPIEENSHLKFKGQNKNKQMFFSETPKTKTKQTYLESNFHNNHILNQKNDDNSLTTVVSNTEKMSASSEVYVSKSLDKVIISVEKSSDFQKTTLPSVFDENLIPPLPQIWPEDDEDDELWSNLDTKVKLDKETNFVEDDFDLGLEDPHLNNESEGESQSNSSQNINNLKLSSNKPLSSDKVSFIERKYDTKLLNKENKMNTINKTTETKFNKIAEFERRNSLSMTKLSKQNLLEKPQGSLKKNYSEEKIIETIPTVKIAGKADTNEPAPSYAKERISFITIPPGNQWHLWGSFTGRRRVDPFFEFSNTNVTSDITQVYTAYWGGASNNARGIAGVWILRLGAGIALLTLVLTVIAQTVRFCQPLLSQKAVLTTNLATSLGAAHLVFIFGIQATDGVWTCGVAALFLHFLYLLTCNWLLALSIRLLRSLLKKKPIPTAAYCIPVWIASLAVVVVSYGMNPSGYETKLFCWLSVERGMLFAFIGPVCTLLMVNAGVCIASQKVLLDAGGKTDPCDKRDLRVGVVLLPLHGVAWFLTVVALEDDLSLALDAAAALTTASVGLLTLQFYVPSWQFFFLEFASPCPPSSSSSTAKQMPMTEVQDTAHLPLLHNRLSGYSFSSPSTSSASVVEEYQLEPIFTGNERRNAY